MCQTTIAVILAALLEAIKRDDVNSVINFQSTIAELFELAARKWGENPLLVACKYGSRLVAERIARQYPKLCRMKDKKDGHTPLHVACARGDLQLVEVLVELEPKLCLVKDKYSMIPLQTAVVNGRADVLKPLIQSCPESARRMTVLQETVFHLAAGNDDSDTFEALIEVVSKPDRRNLLHRKDREGNNVLHMATSKKIIKVVKMLLSQSPTTIGAMVRVNSLNKKGLTALDLCYEHSWDRETDEISDILRNAGAVEGHALPWRASQRWTLETKNIVLLVLGIVIGAIFTSICNLPKSFLEGIPPAGTKFSAEYLVMGHLPPVFNLIVADTAILLVCLGGIVVLTWSIPFRAVMLFVTITVGIVYGMLVDNIMPNFWVCFGTDHKVSSSVLAWVLAVASIAFGAMAYQAIRFAMLACLPRSVKWRFMKTSSVHGSCCFALPINSLF